MHQPPFSPVVLYHARYTMRPYVARHTFCTACPARFGVPEWREVAAGKSAACSASCLSCVIFPRSAVISHTVVRMPFFSRTRATFERHLVTFLSERLIISDVPLKYSFVIRRRFVPLITFDVETRAIFPRGRWLLLHDRGAPFDRIRVSSLVRANPLLESTPSMCFHLSFLSS